MSSASYPPEAYCEADGRLWWERVRGDGPTGADGAAARAASWLRWNVNPGGRFRTSQLREVLGIRQEHFQRRLRELRGWGWVYVSSKEDPELGEECILEKYGWWPGSEDPRPKVASVSNKTRRAVFVRDGSRCVLCGRAAGEKYDDGGRVTLTVGHLRASAWGGGSHVDNLRTECRRCNESVKSDTGTVLDPDAVLASVKSLKKADRETLAHWIEQGGRSRSALDVAFDQVRLGGEPVKKKVIEYLMGIKRL